jgi:hypothetical protein
MADDFKTSFVDLIKERTSTPLWANFVFVWCVFNWHVLVLIFYSNSGNAVDLIELIKQHNFAFVPVICWSFSITIFVPLLNVGVFWIIERIKVEKANIRLRISKKKSYSYEEYNIISNLFKNERIKFEELNKKFLDSEHLYKEREKEKNDAVRLLNRTKLNNESYDIPIDFFQGALLNSSDLKIEMNYDNPYLCKYKGKDYYYMCRKTEGTFYLLTMLKKDILNASAEINPLSNDLILIRINPNTNGKNYETAILFY